jgi:hypothetical protein
MNAEAGCQASLTEIASDSRLHGQSDLRLHEPPDRGTLNAKP